jgi:hypothetical protein
VNDELRLGPSLFPPITAVLWAVSVASTEKLVNDEAPSYRPLVQVGASSPSSSSGLLTRFPAERLLELPGAMLWTEIQRSMLQRRSVRRSIDSSLSEVTNEPLLKALKRRVREGN